MEENKLIKYETGQLQKVSNQIAVTNKLIDSHNEKEAEEFTQKLIAANQLSRLLKIKAQALIIINKNVELSNVADRVNRLLTEAEIASLQKSDPEKAEEYQQAKELGFTDMVKNIVDETRLLAGNNLLGTSADQLDAVNKEIKKAIKNEELTQSATDHFLNSSSANDRESTINALIINLASAVANNNAAVIEYTPKEIDTIIENPTLSAEERSITELRKIENSYYLNSRTMKYKDNSQLVGMKIVEANPTYHPNSPNTQDKNTAKLSSDINIQNIIKELIKLNWNNAEKKDEHFSFEKVNDSEVQFIQTESNDSKRHGTIKFLFEKEPKLIYDSDIYKGIVCKYEMSLTNDQFHFWNNDRKIDFILRKQLLKS